MAGSSHAARLPSLSLRKAREQNDKIGGIQHAASVRRSSVELYRLQSTSCPNLASLDLDKKPSRQQALSSVEEVREEPALKRVGPRRWLDAEKRPVAGNASSSMFELDRAHMDSVKPRASLCWDSEPFSKQSSGAASDEPVPCSARNAAASPLDLHPVASGRRRSILRASCSDAPPSVTGQHAHAPKKRVSFAEDMEVSEVLRNGHSLITRQRLVSPPARPRMQPRALSEFEEIMRKDIHSLRLSSGSVFGPKPLSPATGEGSLECGDSGGSSGGGGGGGGGKGVGENEGAVDGGSLGRCAQFDAYSTAMAHASLASTPSPRGGLSPERCAVLPPLPRATGGSLITLTVLPAINHADQQQQQHQQLQQAFPSDSGEPSSNVRQPSEHMTALQPFPPNSREERGTTSTLSSAASALTNAPTSRPSSGPSRSLQFSPRHHPLPLPDLAPHPHVSDALLSGAVPALALCANGPVSGPAALPRVGRRRASALLDGLCNAARHDDA